MPAAARISTACKSSHEEGIWPKRGVMGHKVVAAAIALQPSSRKNRGYILSFPEFVKSKRQVLNSGTESPSF